MLSVSEWNLGSYQEELQKSRNISHNWLPLKKLPDHVLPEAPAICWVGIWSFLLKDNFPTLFIIELSASISTYSCSKESSNSTSLLLRVVSLLSLPFFPAPPWDLIFTLKYQTKGQTFPPLSWILQSSQNIKLIIFSSIFKISNALFPYGTQIKYPQFYISNSFSLLVHYKEDTLNSGIYSHFSYDWSTNHTYYNNYNNCYDDRENY